MKERHIKKGLEPQDLLFPCKGNEGKVEPWHFENYLQNRHHHSNIQLWVIFICYKIYMYYRVRSHIILYIVILFSFFFHMMVEGGGGHLFFSKSQKSLKRLLFLFKGF